MPGTWSTGDKQARVTLSGSKMVAVNSVDQTGTIGESLVDARLDGHSPVAQSVERLTVNQEVAGSSPARGANSFKHFRPFHHACPPLVPLSGSSDSPARDSFALGFRSSALTHRLPWLGIQRA